MHKVSRLDPQGGCRARKGRKSVRTVSAVPSVSQHDLSSRGVEVKVVLLWPLVLQKGGIQFLSLEERPYWLGGWKGKENSADKRTEEKFPTDHDPGKGKRTVYRSLGTPLPV